MTCESKSPEPVGMSVFASVSIEPEVSLQFVLSWRLADQLWKPSDGIDATGLQTGAGSIGETSVELQRLQPVLPYFC